ncbi:39698_t:CDS:2, partial [Gigaspora margarita]
NCTLTTIKQYTIHIRRLIKFFNSSKQNQQLEYAQYELAQNSKMKQAYTNNELSNQSVANDDKNEKLKNIEEIQILRPISNIKTRWNSNLLDKPGAKTDAQKLNKYILTNNEWEFLCKLVDVLQPFDQLTTYFSGVKYSTLSVVNPSIKALKYEYASGAELSSEELNQIWNNQEELDNESNSNRIWLMATLLDPRLKGMETWSSEIRNQTIFELCEKFQEILKSTTGKEPSYCQLDQYTTTMPDFMKKVFTSNQSHRN